MHDLLEKISHLSVETARFEADVALFRAELAILGADLASEATNLQVTIRRAESVDDPALPVNDATRTLIGFMALVYLRSPGEPSAAEDSRRRRSASGLLGDEMHGCCGCFKGAPLTSEEEEEKVETVPPNDKMSPSSGLRDWR